MILKTIKFIIFLFASISFSQNAELFDQGNKFYNEGKYFDAIEKS